MGARRVSLLRITALDTHADRSTFSCGVEPLDRYFQQQVTQDIRRRITACFVALTDEQHIAGYYTLAASSVLLTDLPPDMRKKLPRYPSVPVVRMGRLAVSLALKGRGLGGALLADALHRTSRAEVAAYALVVDAKDEQAVDFYRHHGFIQLPDTPMTLLLPFASFQPSQGV
jgi:ribosomal protein S18 acetylase RimI-like enzyme